MSVFSQKLRHKISQAVPTIRVEGTSKQDKNNFKGVIFKVFPGDVKELQYSWKVRQVHKCPQDPSYVQVLHCENYFQRS